MASWKAYIMVQLEYGEAIGGWHDHATEHNHSSNRLLLHCSQMIIKGPVLCKIYFTNFS